MTTDHPGEARILGTLRAADGDLRHGGEFRAHVVAGGWEGTLAADAT